MSKRVQSLHDLSDFEYHCKRSCNHGSETDVTDKEEMTEEKQTTGFENLDTG